MNKILLLLGMVCLTFSAMADSVFGYWKTIDDETGKPKSIVQIYEYKGQVCGRVVELLQNPNAKAKLPGSPAIKGLDIIWGLKKDGSKYDDGEVLDPQNGKVYDAQIWLEGGKLVLRGSIFGFGRKQTWIRVKDYQPESDEKPVLRKPRLK